MHIQLAAVFHKPPDERFDPSQNLKIYIILTRELQPTAQWSNDDKQLRAKGGWVTRMAVSTCSDIYNEHEEYLVEMAPKSCTVDYEAGKKTCRYAPLPPRK